jgi:hypothetical protein
MQNVAASAYVRSRYRQLVARYKAANICRNNSAVPS